MVKWVARGVILVARGYICKIVVLLVWGKLLQVMEKSGNSIYLNMWEPCYCFVCMKHLQGGKSCLAGCSIAKYLLHCSLMMPPEILNTPLCWVVKAIRLVIYAYLLWIIGLQSRGSSDRYCSGALFHPNFISLVQVVSGPIQP